jgi:hypothetical protein
MNNPIKIKFPFHVREEDTDLYLIKELNLLIIEDLALKIKVDFLSQALEEYGECDRKRNIYFLTENNHLKIRGSNRGEPYRQGLELTIEEDEFNSSRIFLDSYQIERLKKYLEA